MPEPPPCAPTVGPMAKTARPDPRLRIQAGGSFQVIPIRSCQKFSKQICLWDLAQGIGIISIIQIVEAI